MAQLTICRGLPGSGKTHYALAELASRPRGTLARSCRDTCRRHVFATRYQPDSEQFENLVTTLQHAQIRAALRAGCDVICDDTNLYPEHCQALMRLAIDCGCEWVIQDFTAIPLTTCIERDAARDLDTRVGARVIREMHAKHSVNGWAPMPIPVWNDEPEENLSGRPAPRGL